MDTYCVNNIEIKRFAMPGILSNMYAVEIDRTAIIIDPNIYSEGISYIRERGINNAFVLLTHEHYDHICGVEQLRNEIDNISVICTRKCSENIIDPKKNLSRYFEMLMMEIGEFSDLFFDKEYSCTADKVFEDKYEFKLGGHRILMIEAPGHSQGGCICILDDGIIFTGDNLVEGHGVKCRFPGGNKRSFIQHTLPLFESINNDCYVFPGHGKPGLYKDLKCYLYFE